MPQYQPNEQFPQDRQARLAYLSQFMKLTSDQRNIIRKYLRVIKLSNESITEDILSSLSRASDNVTKSSEILADVLSRVNTESLVMYRAAEELFQLTGGEVIHTDRNYKWSTKRKE